MRLTPLDIQNHRFVRRLRGADPAEVESFLRLVSEDYASLVLENEALKTRSHDLEKRVAELEGQERALRETLVMAQTIAEDLKTTAVHESENLIGQAEVKAEKILDAAHRRSAKLAEDIRELKSLRTRLTAAVRTTIETHLTLLEGLSDPLPEDPLLDGKVTYLTRPAPVVAQGGGGGA